MTELIIIVSVALALVVVGAAGLGYFGVVLLASLIRRCEEGR
jgi:hypothetical protein